MLIVQRPPLQYKPIGLLLSSARRRRRRVLAAAVVHLSLRTSKSRLLQAS